MKTSLPSIASATFTRIIFCLPWEDLAQYPERRSTALRMPHAKWLRLCRRRGMQGATL